MGNFGLLSNRFEEETEDFFNDHTNSFVGAWDADGTGTETTYTFTNNQTFKINDKYQGTYQFDNKTITLTYEINQRQITYTYQFTNNHELLTLTNASTTLYLDKKPSLLH